jgi:hypothetical protein
MKRFGVFILTIVFVAGLCGSILLRIRLRPSKIRRHGGRL